MSLTTAKKLLIGTLSLASLSLSLRRQVGGDALEDDEAASETRINSSSENRRCPRREPLPAAPRTPLQYNGISWPTYCFEGDDREEHLFILGDWGGLNAGGHVAPARNTNWWHGRYFKTGIDDQAQRLVAIQMRRRAKWAKPRLVLNGGDNFYWGGINGQCCKPMDAAIRDFRNQGNPATQQFKFVFEDMYSGKYLEDVPWLLCFGNHDYGGFTFNTAWDQQIAYTWGPTDRWILPAQYWHQHVDFPSKHTSMDIYMIDTNIQDVDDPKEDPGHNICSEEHSKGATCEACGGPRDAHDCVKWFEKLWQDQVKWMEEKICASTADWQIIVTHFPPQPWKHHSYAYGDWKRISKKCGIDFFVGSHRHDQEIHQWSDAGFPWIVAGGGGGVTSEKKPGDNNQYGFFDMIVTKERLQVHSINQIGRDIQQLTIAPRNGTG